MGNYFNEVLNLALPGLGIMVTLMLILWVIHIPIKNAAIVDVGWGGGLIILALLYYFYGSGYEPRKLLITIMVFIWGSRLTYYLFTRIINDKNEDGRYIQMRKDWGNNIALKFLFFFEFQAVLNVILSLPFLLIALNPEEGISLSNWIGFAIWLTALIGELTSDAQLKSFKKGSQNSGKVCNTGLWKYSRHPNYFFEFIIWVGYSITAFSSPFGFVSIISPLIILYLLLKVTGIPATEEQALRSKGEAYKEYQNTTSKFIPWKPKEA